MGKMCMVNFGFLLDFFTAKGQSKACITEGKGSIPLSIFSFILSVSGEQDKKILELFGLRKCLTPSLKGVANPFLVEHQKQRAF